jgi:endogenous inhibitor of DNA gyrase (YacG/DUF329 family)
MRDDPDREEDVSESEMPDESDVKEGGQESGTYPCPYCGQEVYEEALRCPHCGRYVSREEAKARHPWQWVMLVVLLALGVLLVWALAR